MVLLGCFFKRKKYFAVTKEKFLFFLPSFHHFLSSFCHLQKAFFHIDERISGGRLIKSALSRIYTEIKKKNVFFRKFFLVVHFFCIDFSDEFLFYWVLKKFACFHLAAYKMNFFNSEFKLMLVIIAYATSGQVQFNFISIKFEIVKMGVLISLNKYYNYLWIGSSLIFSALILLLIGDHAKCNYNFF